MAAREATDRVNIITHIHTVASDSRASSLDHIDDAIRQVCGADTPIHFTECFTDIEHLSRLTRAGKGRFGPVHMVLTTDHMRDRSHRLPPQHMAAAALNHRIALGAELATHTRDVDGKYRKGPEILAYGGIEPIESPYGPYYGLSQELLEELYETCMAIDGEELCTRKAADLLNRRGIAHALSHPLDEHELSCEGTFAIISEFAFSETVNGGFFARSARVLESYMRVNNAILDGAVIPEDQLSERGRRIVAHIRKHGRCLHPLGGSDAHLWQFDRVVTSMAVPPDRRAEELSPGDLFETMLRFTRAPHASEPFSTDPDLDVVGDPATPLDQTTDIAGIIAINLFRNRGHIKYPSTLAKMLAKAVLVSSRTLRSRAQARGRLFREIKADFDPVLLLSLLEASGPRQNDNHAPHVCRLPGWHRGTRAEDTGGVLS